MNASDQGLHTLSQAARRAGVTRKAIRTWEDKGLLPPPERTGAGYRLFTADDIAVLRFIRQAKTLGLALAEINDILSLQRDGAQPCTRVTQLLDAHIDQIDRTLAELRQPRHVLVGAREPPTTSAGPAATPSSARSSKQAASQTIRDRPCRWPYAPVTVRLEVTGRRAGLAAFTNPIFLDA